MISNIKLLIVLMVAVFNTSAVLAQESTGRRDASAIDVLQKMSAYTASLDQLVIKGAAFTDARLDAGLMVVNSNEVTMTIDRPGSMHIASFDGEEEKHIYFHKGNLTVYSSENNYYGQASIPQELEAAADFAIEELDVEAPLIDLIYRDLSTQLANSDDSIIYLSDKSRVAGVDCHQLVIRGLEVDLQVWIEEGDRPLPRKIVMTSKWESGSPRFTANLAWDTAPKISKEEFVFNVPEGAVNIGFIQQTTKE
ncbi:MAG: DUF2092 domain-containing protein [Halioglobus sp.]